MTANRISDALKNNASSKEYLFFLQQFQEKLSIEELQQLNVLILAEPTWLKEFHTATEASKYLQTCWLNHPHRLLNFLQTAELAQPWTEQSYLAQLSTRVIGGSSDDFNAKIRIFRQFAMWRIIWRDFNRLNSTEQTTSELSYLAKACIQACLNLHYTTLEEKFGTPTNKYGDKQPMLILGMGKLGANELNLSSDIDLIFAYPETGETQLKENQKAKKTLSNQEFFNRLGKLIIQSLDQQSIEGFVFRVDMRLRPYGESGPLVSYFDALENYYQTQGREWERYAMVKARVVATTGDDSHTTDLMQILNSFTFRRYIDFSVITALRKLKQMIQQEVNRRGLDDDVKLGQGGIREIEFIAQAFQLIRGGRDTELQDNRILKILPLLESSGSLPEGKSNALADAYRFLRNTEHAIQGYEDKQTQKLPDTPQQQTLIAKVMGFENWQEFYVELNRHRQRVREEFHAVIADPNEEQNTPCTLEYDWQSIWQQQLTKEECIELFSTHNHESPELSFSIISELANNSLAKGLHASGRERLDEFMPLLLTQVTESNQPTETLKRISALVKSVMRRSSYLLLLIENPKALEQLIKLTIASPWIAEQLAQFPALLDELLDPRSLYSPPEKADLEDELRRTLLRIDPDDLEANMEALRHFRSSHALRVAACEITEALPIMKVSDYLTHIAEIILEFVTQHSWKQMTAKHGYPDGTERDNANLIIIGYGKLGGIELGHGSDLDMVFLHGAKPTGFTNGEKPLDNQTFYTRLGQKIIHFLTTKMASGDLYDVDMRLRPNGESGLLVPTLDGFKKYQSESAWTWEYQALTRARVITGDNKLSQRFLDIRHSILTQKRDLNTLRKDVVEMRVKMRNHLGSDKKGEGTKNFHLKQDPGGIVDIEFMVQYAVLAWANTEPALVTYTDNIRILECLAHSNLLATQEVEQLIEAYKVFRAEGHRLTLQQQPSLIANYQLIPERENVIFVWEKLMNTNN